MKRRFKYGTLSFLAFVIVAGALYWWLAGNPFKTDLASDRDQVAIYLEQAAQAIKNCDWEEADRYCTKAHQWTRTDSRLNLVAGRADMEALERDFDRLVAAIDIQERADAYLIVTELKTRWQQLGRP